MRKCYSMKRSETDRVVLIYKLMQVGYLRRKGMMVAFLVFIALMIVSIVGGIWISMYLYRPDGTRCLSEHQCVTLNQEVAMEGRPYNQRRRRRRMKADNIGMRECACRVGSVCVGVLAVMILLIVMFLNAAR
jgi:hypothetical protein